MPEYPQTQAETVFMSLWQYPYSGQSLPEELLHLNRYTDFECLMEALEVLGQDFTKKEIEFIFLFLALSNPSLTKAQLDSIGAFLKVQPSSLFLFYAALGRVDCLQAQALENPEQFKIHLDEWGYRAFCWAAQNGQLGLMRYLAEQAPEHFQTMTPEGKMGVLENSRENVAIKEYLDTIPLRANSLAYETVDNEFYPFFYQP